ncbi:MAG: GspE/PulE family protein [Candidatus Margulisbacteria bacterium]|nr:GspE/PulE family protein [Candidatus Margulisiibacteriota bacterium]
MIRDKINIIREESSSSTPALLNEILNKAVALNASDIHLEPRENYLRTRFRVDGLLQNGPSIHKAKYASLLSRIKVMVNLDIAESRQPQDGRTNITIDKLTFDVRVSTIPTIHGEKAVLRLLNRQHAALKIDELGMEPPDLEIYKKIISKKTGIVLVTGPTGSGKTTTLYATLSYLNSKEINISTIEDPVEYQLPAINQIQINPKAGLTFARGLRSLLRQDPDIIMVGEIRDLETAKIALQAALTGHLVFSTLHTNDAPSAIARLMDIGIEKYLIDASVLGVVGQRLVRKKTDNGYQGRIGVYEVMCGCSPPPGMRTMAQNGQLKVEQGLTTREELARVLYLDTPM